MKKINLSQNQVAIVDDEDFDKLNQHKWHAHYKGKKFYAVRNVRKNERIRTIIRMHRAIINPPAGKMVDHANGNALDNRKQNLRFCTNQQNRQNQIKPQSNNTLGVKGVSWHKHVKKFRATIKANGKQIYLGYFNVLGDADDVYRKAEKKYFGKFSREEVKYAL